jgi:uncharacterized protein YaaN involved in tellurite resistance
MNTNKDSFDELKMKLAELEITMLQMNQKMDRIVESLEKDCKKMTSHIDFVENVYDKVKQPFTYLMDNVSSMMNRTITYSRVVEPQRIDNPQTESLEELDRDALKELQW